MAIDVTDATFETDVIDRSRTVTVLVDLWAPWCGPCRTLGPILERVTAATDGKVELVKVNVDENPAISQAFRVQSIPAVYALQDGAVVDGFMGALPEHQVQEFVDALAPSQAGQARAELLASGDEEALRAALAEAPADEELIVTLAQLLVDRGETDEVLALLARIPETEITRPLAAAARLASSSASGPTDDHDATLTALLEQVKSDEDARQQFLDILELMGPHDPRTAGYRKQLTARLF